MNLPERQDIIWTINRVQNRHRPLNPGSLEELNIVHPYTETILGETFLQYDSGVQDPNRFLLFYKQNSLSRLCNSRIMLCDGTFKTVPSMFYQLYSLHGIVQDHTFPLIYVLTNSKTEDFYRRMLVQVKQHAEQLNYVLQPQYISADFELAFFNAARGIFPNSRIHGCLFHNSEYLEVYSQ